MISDKCKINYLNNRYDMIENRIFYHLYKVYDEYSLWDKKVKILDNSFCPDIKVMNNMIGGVFDFCLNIRWVDSLENFDLFDFPYITCDSYHFYLKDVEFTKG